MVHGLSTCAHCGALLNGPLCAICGKSERDAVETIDPAPARRSLSADSKRQLRSVAGFVVVAAVLATVGYTLLTRESTEPAPLALATPTPTSSTTTVPPPTVRPPTIDRPEAAVEPLPTIAVGAERFVEPSDGANPWNGALAHNVLSGATLDNTDYRPGIDAVTARVAAIPSEFVTAAPTRSEWNGVDLADAERSQPFAARSIGDGAGPIADVWIIARGPSTQDGSAAFLDQARALWPIADPLASFSPRPGVRLLQLSDDGTETLWIDQRDDWLALYRTPSGTDPGLLGAISDGWA